MTHWSERHDPSVFDTRTPRPLEHLRRADGVLTAADEVAWLTEQAKRRAGHADRSGSDGALEV